MERGRISPTANRDQGFQMPVLFLELVESFEVSVEILSIIVPRVTRVVDLLVCPRVREKDFSRIRFQIRKSIEYVAIYTMLK